MSGHDTAPGPGEGWRVFASVTLVVAGVMRIFDGIWALRYAGVTPDRLEGAVLGTSLKTYGWLYLAVGAVLVFASFGVLKRAGWARWVGVAAGGALAITAVWWLPFYPVWSLVYVGLGMLVCYALVVHGGRTQG